MPGYVIVSTNTCRTFQPNVILWNFELKAVYTAQKPLFH